jgi:hypothetical protein
MLQKRAVAKPIGYYQEQYKDEKQAIYRAYLLGGYTLKQIGTIMEVLHYDKSYRERY